MSPVIVCLVFIAAFGACIGSFLNVVIYRLPRDKSLAMPPSSCPACDKRIAFYDNIPLVSWILLGGKCRNCKAKISIRYFIIELITALFFVGVFVLYFVKGHNRFELAGKFGLDAFFAGGYVFYLMHMALIAGLIASSAIDLELWVIPLNLCWFMTAVGFVGSAIGGRIIGAVNADPLIVGFYRMWPGDSSFIAAMGVGACVGMIISLILLKTGKIKPSYEVTSESSEQEEDNYNHRAQMGKEIIFLLPIVILAVVFGYISKGDSALAGWWANVSQIPVIKGFTNSLFGYFVGCAVVWITRILGTLGFGKEAMGLGDVHLMGAAGAVIGPVFVVIAFFIAPFFGLIWALGQMFFKETRQIPYGPFLSLGVFGVMILHDGLRAYIQAMFFLPS